METFKKKQLGKKLLALSLAVAFVVLLAPTLASAQQGLSAQEKEERRARLQAELDDVQKQINSQQVRLDSKRQERQSLERDVEILEGEINKAQLEIREKDIRINELGSGINEKEEHITTLNSDIERKKEQLADILRRKAALSDVSLVEIALSNESLSEFFSDLNIVSSLNDALQTSFAQIRTARAEAKDEQQAMASQQEQVTDTRQAISAQKEQVEVKEAEKEELAAVARGEERSYADVLAQKQAEAQRIRNELFSLRDVQAIPFGRALQYAREVSAATGVRPAFLLAILQQESNLGQNVGTCNRPQDPPSKQWDQIMKPSRDIEPYKRIVAGLGVSETTYPLSCPLSYGWGGAMGPAQFIPSTWEAYQNQIANALGVSVPNPWEPKHAFMASGVLLSDLGAGVGGYSAEKRAAAKYYAGGNWQGANGQNYGQQVVSRAANIQSSMIDPLDAVQ